MAPFTMWLILRATLFSHIISEPRLWSLGSAQNCVYSTCCFWAARRIRQVLGISLRWLIPIGRALIHVSALLGSTAGGVMVEISGYSGNERLSETWCVSAGEGGERIPAVLTAIAADMVLRGEITGNGIVPLPDWITRDRLVAELAAWKIRVAVRSEGGEWRAFDDGAAFTKSTPILPRMVV